MRDGESCADHGVVLNDGVATELSESQHDSSDRRGGIHAGRIILIFMSAFGAYQTFYGEKISINGGLGFDGMVFETIATRLPEVLQKGADDYFIQRILPSTVVRFALQIAGMPLNTANVIRGFQAYNFFVIIVAVFIWLRIAARLNLSSRGTIIGFLGLFMNFAVAKFYFYYPVLTDATAFAISLGMILCYLGSHSALLIALTILGSFTWPTLLLQGLIFFLFPRSEEVPIIPASQGRARRGRNMWTAAFCAFIFGGAVLFVNYMLRHDDQEGMHMILPLREVSIALIVAYAFFAFWCMSDHDGLYARRFWTKPLRPGRVFIALGVWCAVKLIVLLVSGAHSPLIAHSLKNLAFIGAKAPGLFLIAHVAFFGPMVVLAILHGRDLCRMIVSQGPAMTLVALLGIIFSFSAEARHSTAVYPVFAVFTAAHLDRLRPSNRQVALLAVISVAFSKIWLTINDDFSVPLTRESSLQFPWQSYFQHHGQHMSPSSYIAHACVVAAAFLLLGILFRLRTEKSEAADRTGGKG